MSSEEKRARRRERDRRGVRRLGGRKRRKIDLAASDGAASDGTGGYDTYKRRHASWHSVGEEPKG